ncbi:MAG: ATP-binding protein [Archaeoglobaceae archaeon]|nr:ATP-binding protein [Archaeoglobaceae archaeon]MDW8118205.1 ATP-binding protein [Archaeoglobaceae archaeon]
MEDLNWKIIVDELSSGVVIVNRLGKVVYVNKILGEVSGLEYEEMLNNPHKYFVPEDYTKLAELVVRTFVERRKKVDPPLIIRSFDAYGNMRWIEARARFAEMSGKPYCLLVYTDVSERVALQKRVEELNEYLRLLNSMIRHDILNIFTRIYSFLELLEEEYSPEFLEKVKKAVDSGIEFIKKMKELESTMEIKRNPYKLKNVLKEVADSYGAKIIVEGDIDAEILANEGIYNIFGNLIGNAIKHGKASEVRVKISTNDENVEVLLEDNGTGIPEENVSKLFTKGFTTGGSGLGLFIVKQLMKSLDGEITLINPQRSAFLLKFRKTKKENQILDRGTISASSSP